MGRLKTEEVVARKAAANEHEKEDYSDPDRHFQGEVSKLLQKANFADELFRQVRRYEQTIGRLEAENSQLRRENAYYEKARRNREHPMSKSDETWAFQHNVTIDFLRKPNGHSVVKIAKRGRPKVVKEIGLQAALQKARRLWPLDPNLLVD